MPDRGSYLDLEKSENNVCLTVSICHLSKLFLITFSFSNFLKIFKALFAKPIETKFSKLNKIIIVPVRDSFCEIEDAESFEGKFWLMLKAIVESKLGEVFWLKKSPQEGWVSETFWRCHLVACWQLSFWNNWAAMMQQVVLYWQLQTHKRTFCCRRRAHFCLKRSWTAFKRAKLGCWFKFKWAFLACQLCIAIQNV